MRHARIHDNTVVEILTPVDDFQFSECFHPDIVSQCVACSEDVQIGWAFVGGVFVAPAVQETPPAE